jgi:DNA helicase-2/ATP-dependent DNA helicase PcrA
MNDSREALSVPEHGIVRGEGRSPSQLAAVVTPGRALTREQEEIVGAGLGPALVVAGAGSGKTETLSMRILYLLDNARALWGRDISPDELLCLTFTRKAAGEIAQRASERIAALYGRDPSRPEVTVATYNGYAAGITAEHGLRVAVDPESTVLTDASLWQLADAVVQSWDAPIDTESAVSTVTAAVPRLAQQARDHGVSPGELEQWAREALAFMEALPKKEGDSLPGAMTQALASRVAKVRTLASLAELIAEFDRRKRDASQLDFSDQVDVAVRLSRLAHVRAVERSRYRAVLLDEFQDTSPPQLDLFAQMFGAQFPVMAVGDPHQAIYGFRGASAAALSHFVERFGGTAVARHTLSVSWRNEASILAAANASVEPLNAAAVAGVPLRSRGEELGVPEPARMGPGVEVSRLLTSDDEADAVVAFLVRKREEIAAGSDDALVTSAVLCRRRAQIAPIADALQRAGIDFEIVGLGGLIDVPEVADLVALLEIAHDPTRGDALMRLLSGERIALGPHDLAALYDRAVQLAGPRGERESSASIIDALAALPEPGWVSHEGRSLTPVARDRLERLAAVVDAIRRHTYLSLPELVLFAERAWGLDIEAAVARPAAKARRAVDAFVDAARSFAAGAEHATLGAFLAWLEAVRLEEDGLSVPVREPDPRAVQLLTVHGAKGLEWDVVAVPGLNDGQFPKVTVPSQSTPVPTDLGWLEGIGNLPNALRRDRDQLPEWGFHAARDHKGLQRSIDDFREQAGAHRIDEERRLFYVALTRAKSHVLLSGSWFTGGKTRLAPSPYVTELVERGVVSVGDWVEPPPDGAPPPPRERAPGVWPRPVTSAQAQRRELAALVESLIRERADSADGPSLAALEREVPLAREIAAMLAERASRGVDPVSLPHHLSTSALVSLARDRDAFADHVRRPMPTEPTVAAQRGSALHAWIEQQFGHTMLLDDDLLASGILGPDEETARGAVASELDALKARFAGSEWARRTPIAIEVDVELPVGGVTIRSRIDAVFPPGAGLERITVVDWKSGAPPRDDAERAAREVQLAVYRLAWATWQGLPLESVDAAFYYVASDTTARPERLLTEPEIVALLSGEAG